MRPLHTASAATIPVIKRSGLKPLRLVEKLGLGPATCIASKKAGVENETISSISTYPSPASQNSSNRPIPYSTPIKDGRSSPSSSFSSLPTISSSFSSMANLGQDSRASTPLSTPPRETSPSSSFINDSLPDSLANAINAIKTTNIPSRSLVSTPAKMPVQVEPSTLESSSPLDRLMRDMTLLISPSYSEDSSLSSLSSDLVRKKAIRREGRWARKMESIGIVCA